MSLPDKLDTLKDVYILEKHRLSSFKSWPFDGKSSCSKLHMAQAGFYWSGSEQEPDTATCFVCNKTLDGWEKTDEPWNEHAKHAPQCAFVKYGRPESAITVREFLDIFGVVIKNKVVRDVEKRKTELRNYAAKDLQRFNEKKI